MLRLPAPLFTIALSATALAACDPYDPDLGDTPFKCASKEPRCPDGYTCENDGVQDVCVRPDSSAGEVDAASTFQCANDSSIEPNNEPNTAFVTPVPSMPSYSLIGLALCPSGDRDHYKFDINTTGLNFEAQVVGVASRPSPVLNILSANGTVIESGDPVAGSPQVVRVEIPNRLAVGSYIVQVQSGDGGENNYDLSIKVCPSSDVLPCDN